MSGTRIGVHDMEAYDKKRPDKTQAALDELYTSARQAGLQAAIDWLYQEGYEEAGFVLRETVNAGNL